MHENRIVDKQGSHRECQQFGMGQKPSKRSQNPPLNKKRRTQERFVSRIRQENIILRN